MRRIRLPGPQRGSPCLSRLNRCRSHFPLMIHSCHPGNTRDWNSHTDSFRFLWPNHGPPENMCCRQDPLHSLRIALRPCHPARNLSGSPRIPSKLFLLLLLQSHPQCRRFRRRLRPHQTCYPCFPDSVFHLPFLLPAFHDQSPLTVVFI